MLCTRARPLWAALPVRFAGVGPTARAMSIPLQGRAFVTLCRARADSAAMMIREGAVALRSAEPTGCQRYSQLSCQRGSDLAVLPTRSRLTAPQCRAFAPCHVPNVHPRNYGPAVAGRESTAAQPRPTSTIRHRSAWRTQAEGQVKRCHVVCPAVLHEAPGSRPQGNTPAARRASPAAPACAIAPRRRPHCAQARPRGTPQRSPRP